MKTTAALLTLTSVKSWWRKVCLLGIVVNKERTFNCYWVVFVVNTSMWNENNNIALLATISICYPKIYLDKIHSSLVMNVHAFFAKGWLGFLSRKINDFCHGNKKKKILPFDVSLSGRMVPVMRNLRTVHFHHWVWMSRHKSVYTALLLYLQSPIIPVI